MIIVLIGYMASGKSTIGKILSSKLNYRFVDLDDFIESNENLNISEIFQTKGEIYFRKLESNYLNLLINDYDDIVLSLGGGTPCYANNINTIINSEKTTSIYLKASITTITKRLKNEKAKRPLVAHLKTEEDLIEFIGKHLFERSTYYNQANYSISIDDKTKEDIIEEIIFDLF